MAAFKAGDRVSIVKREVTPEDQKESLYFDYFGGLTGTVDRTYDEGTVCVEIDLDSLTEDTRKRHLEMQEAERKRWLESVSNEMRSRLTPEQQQLRISYKLLVSRKDLEPLKGGKPTSSGTSKKNESNTVKESKQGPEEAPVSASKAKDNAEETAKRLSAADLDAAEEAFLKQQQGKS